MVGDDKIKVLILFLTYGNRYPCSLKKFLQICTRIGLEKRLIIIKNDREEMETRQVESWVFEMGGDNSVFEFSGWQKAIDSEIAHSFAPDVYLIANDSFLKMGPANSFYTLPIFDDEIIRMVYKNKLLGGHKMAYPLGELSPFIHTHFFLLSAEIVERLGSIVTERSSERFTKSIPPAHLFDAFQKNEILTKRLKKYLYYNLTQRRYGKKASLQGYEDFRRKVLCIINEMSLSARVRKIGYRIVDLTPFHSLFNLFYILPIPFRPVVPFQFMRKIIFSIFYLLFYSPCAKKIGLEKWFTELCLVNVKRRLRREISKR